MRPLLLWVSMSPCQGGSKREVERHPWWNVPCARCEQQRRRVHSHFAQRRKQQAGQDLPRGWQIWVLLPLSGGFIVAPSNDVHNWFFLSQFASVPELVTFYQSVSLREYNRTLDTRLLYPVSRFSYNINGIDIILAGTTSRMWMWLGGLLTLRRSS